ncbi:MAG: amidohydrolase family protein [Rhodospirillaceae bacterium]|jgi:N-acyl-D-amino-acid deacylase|nr:amidohydrolase family protein [Rhodospirillaceae bacterium]MBT6139479.1 amidohydrolase family protein [Rhodospirillaceae bacterium]
MHDLVIRGGTIIDGTGADRFTGDLAVDDGVITQVGGKAGAASREIQADGLLVTPGWVDVHTHYDGQATWDPELASSSWNGSTTILFGNCGVGFAPVRTEHHEALIDLMEGVEDIPGIALAEGLDWDWESFPEYMDALERRDRVIDVAAQMPHHALRVYVMGERAIRHELATSEDIEIMARLTGEAIQAGAFGFTTSRTDSHKTTSGDFVPGRYSGTDELVGIGRELGRLGAGVFGLISDFEDEDAEFEWMTKLSAETGRPFWFLLTDRGTDPQRWRRLIAGAKAAEKQGASITAQVAGRPVGLVLGLTTSLTPFSVRSTFRELDDLSAEDKLARLRDPEVKRAILGEEVSDRLLKVLPPLTQAIATRWDRMYVLGDPPNYEPTQDQSVAALAERAGKSPEEFAYDYLVGGDGNAKFLFPVTNYVTGDLEPVREMITNPDTVLGLSDGGAHCGIICDASVPSFMLSHWGRDRSRGERLPVEWLVKKQTADTADFFGFKDRGRLQPGKKADVNLIDFEKLQPRAPEIVNDLPAGGKRLIQKVDGYAATIVSGETIFERGVATGARPGKLVRAGR